MITEKKFTLSQLLHSREGVHLSLYIENSGDTLDVRSRLRSALREAEAAIGDALPTARKRRFLAPVEGFIADLSRIRGIRGNIGVFRTEDSFRVLSLPVKIEYGCFVADSFHVKPLLRWLQADREFLLLGVGERFAHLYQGDRGSFRKVDSILLPEGFSTCLRKSYGIYGSREQRTKADEAYGRMNAAIREITGGRGPKLYVAGEQKVAQSMIRRLKYRPVSRAPISSSIFDEDHAGRLCGVVRRAVETEVRASLERTLSEFESADRLKLAKVGLLEVAKAAVKGRVRKLLVSGESRVFGRIDPESGRVQVHPRDLNTEDDDLLDDLAQLVLSRGGEIVVADQKQIPQGRPMMALLSVPASAKRRKEVLS